MIQMGLLSAMSLLHYLGMNKDNFDSWFENYYSNQINVKWNNCLIHKSGYFDIHYWSHNLLHILHKEFQIHKSLHVQQLVDNNNQLQIQNQVKLGNCLIHIKDHHDTHHDNHSLLHFQNKCYIYRIHHLQYLQWNK